MNVRRLASRLGIAFAVLLAPLSVPVGCSPPSEGRPAGSIEVKNARSSAADLDATKAKAKSSPKRR
jgi:hypothetical protein